MAKKHASKPKPKGPTLEQRLAKSPALVKKYQSNPGLRSKYLKGNLEKYLTPAQKQKRQLNVRLNAPITPGSSTTERDLAHEAQAATTVRYAPQEREINQQLGVAQQTERDTGSFYDQYRAALQQHAANIAGYQAGAQQAMQQLQAGVTGLGQQAATQMAQSAAPTQSAVAAPSSDISALANAALATRQAQAGTFGAEQAMTGAAANQYADTQANVVAPGQKLSALAQARGRTRDIQQKKTDLATEKGAYNEQFRDTRRQDEFKNQLAMSTLNLNKVKTAADIANTQADNAANTPTAKAAAAGAETSAREEAKNAAKLGISVHQYRMLGPTVRKRKLDALKAKTKTGTEHRIRSGPFAGLLPSQVDKMTPDQVQKRIDAASKDGGTKTTDAKAFRDKYHVDLQPTSAHNRALNDVQNAQTAFGQVGKTVKQQDGRNHVVTPDDVVADLRDKGTSNLWIRVGLEMKRGGLTPGTAYRIHKAGYSVSQLGLKMRGGGRVKTGSRGDAQ